MSRPRFVFPTLLLLLIILGIVPLTSAQTENKTAQKFDEFGDIVISDIKARLDNFAVQLQNEPLSKGFILVYRSRRDLPGLSYRYAHRMEDYLVNNRGLERRLVAVDGGEADCLRQELWIVPPGTAPIPRSDAYQRHFVDTNSAREFDELSGGSEDTTTNVHSEDLEAYAAALRAEPHARAYLIAYAGYSRLSFEENGKLVRSTIISLDPTGAARKLLTDAQKLLLKEFHISPTRIRLVDGGYRKRGAIELWIVPQGEHPPIPTPNSFPPKRKRSK